MHASPGARNVRAPLAAAPATPMHSREGSLVLHRQLQPAASGKDGWTGQEAPRVPSCGRGPVSRWAFCPGRGCSPRGDCRIQVQTLETPSGHLRAPELQVLAGRLHCHVFQERHAERDSPPWASASLNHRPPHARPGAGEASPAPACGAPWAEVLLDPEV